MRAALRTGLQGVMQSRRSTILSGGATRNARHGQLQKSGNVNDPKDIIISAKKWVAAPPLAPMDLCGDMMPCRVGQAVTIRIFCEF